MYAEQEFSGVAPNRHGGTEAQHIKALKAMGAPIPEDDHTLPEQVRYLFDLFMQLRFSRIPNDDGFSLMARESLRFSDIHYNSQLTGLKLERHEIEAIMSLNSIFDKHSG